MLPKQKTIVTRRVVTLIAALALVSLACAQQTPSIKALAACGTPAALGDGWPIAKPEDAGLDGARLCDIAARLAATEANVHGIVVARHGKLVFEQYFPGHDSPWNAKPGQFEFSAETKHDMRSVSKSVTSLLLGIALDRKLIANADEPVIKFFPEYAALKTPGWEKITLRHLLTMSSGLEWNENLPWNPKNDEWHLANDEDPLSYVLQRRAALPPGTVWNYNGGGPELLGKIIEKVSGQQFEMFARAALFEPLGITDWEWKPWPNGKLAAAGGLRLRPRDAAKIGQLILNNGRWNGRQIVSPGWIADSIKPRFRAIGYFGGLFFYGYQWWMGRTLSGDKEVTWIAGVGLGGQRLFVIPSLDLVVAVTSGLYASPRQSNAPLEILYRFVIPAVRDKGSDR